MKAIKRRLRWCGQGWKPCQGQENWWMGCLGRWCEEEEEEEEEKEQEEEEALEIVLVIVIVAVLLLVLLWRCR
jgi:hypothetical protein